MTTLVDDALERLAAHTRGMAPASVQEPLSLRVANALGWQHGSARVNQRTTDTPRGSLNLAKGLLGPQPATIFAADGAGATHRMLRDAARFAYHSSVHWGLVCDDAGIVIFNSHWIRDEEWFRLPEISWQRLDEHLDLLTALTPTAMTEGRIDHIAASMFQPDRFLMPVDDALVARLDNWRLEALRHGRDATGLDEALHTLFAQLFVLRAVEDRRLEPNIPPLERCLAYSDSVDTTLIEDIFARARGTIQSELFAENRLSRFPDFVLSGIIRDLYFPQQLPHDSQRYNFDWIDADVLGRAYEKYLANVYRAAPLSPQLRLFDQPVRELEPVSVQKSGGIFYTPSYLVGTLTDQAIERTFADHEEPEFLPHVADFACGSGSFLVEAMNALVRRLRERDPQRNWARVLIEGKHVVGIDIDPRAVTMSRLNLWLRLTEEPDALPLPSIDEVVVLGDSLSDDVWIGLPDAYDVVLGNPPFIATGNVPPREELAKRFQTAQGRYDYAHLFVELGVRRLAPSGILGLVVPNRLFRNRDAGKVREILANETDLLSIIDFGSNEVFKGTSGYIGAIIARKRSSFNSLHPITVRAVLVSDVTDTRYLGGLLVDAVNASGEMTRDVLKAFEISHPVSSQPWVLLPPDARRARLHLEQNSVPLGEFAGTFQGIRTGANDIFIVRIDSTDGPHARIVNGLGDSAIVETAMLRPVVFGSDIQRYDLLRPRQQLIYPYRRGVAISEMELERDFPKTYSYLLTYQELLTGRSSIGSGGIHWYELIRRRDETWLSSPKLLTRDLATRTSFALDDMGQVFLVGGTAVVPPDPQVALALLAYLNSRTANDYLAEITPAFRGAFQKFEPQHLNRLPIPGFLIEFDQTAAQIGDLAHKILQARAIGEDSGDHLAEAEIDRLVAEAVTRV